MITCQSGDLDFSMSTINISQNSDSHPGRKTLFLSFFQCLCQLSADISRPPDRLASGRGSETGIADFPHSRGTIKLPQASLAITVKTIKKGRKWVL
jgi:hypothetical protein